MTERVRVIDEEGINQREMERGVIGENNARASLSIQNFPIKYQLLD